MRGTAIVRRVPVVLVSWSMCLGFCLAENPQELDDLVQSFRRALEADVEDPISERREKLNANYRVALDKAKEELTNRGALNDLIELRKELARIENGEDLPEGNPYKSERVKILADTYQKYSGRIDEDKGDLQEKLAIKLNNALVDLEKELTRQQRVDDALQVRSFRESEEFSKLAGRNAKSLSKPMSSATDTRTPLSGQAQGENAPVLCRVVIVPIGEPSITPDTFAVVERVDRQDIVGVGRTAPPEVGVIAADGSMLHFRKSESEPEVIPGSVLNCAQFTNMPLVGLNSDGTICTSSDGDRNFAAQLAGLTDITYMTVTFNIAAMVNSGGQVIIHGHLDTAPTPTFVKTVSDVKHIGFSGAAFASILKKDGSVLHVRNGEPKEIALPGKIENLLNYQIGENRSGEVFSWGLVPQAEADQLGKNPRQAFAENTRFGGITKDGEVYISMNVNGVWDAQREVSAALHGATSFAWLFDNTGDWIVATLPADTVPRSGLWKAEDLEKAR